MDPRKHDITIRDLLQMKGGIDRDSNLEPLISTSTDWIKTIIHHPLAFTPGDTFCYTSFGAHLLSGVLSRTTGMSAWDFAEEYLCKPLGITIRFWNEDPKGYNFGGGSIYMTSRDMARFGYLYLKDGMLRAERILSSEYIRESFTDHLCEGRSWGVVDDLGYGYLWWLGKIKGHDIRFALGYAGQFIILIPDFDMVIVVTSAFPFTDEDADAQKRAILQLIADRILSAVIN
jgi:CubicO group peptidase (beta-lactamase class C family)